VDYVFEAALASLNVPQHLRACLQTTIGRSSQTARRAFLQSYATCRVFEEDFFKKKTFCTF
jgi:hypothetical protein